MISILKNEIQVGLTQVPFGTTYSQLVFSLNYYIGLEDDHDMGVKFTHTDKKWNYSLAFQECRRVEVWCN
jgi:hypothetical protein